MAIGKYLKTWKLCFLSVISITLMVTTLIHQYSQYSSQRIYVMKAYFSPNTSQFVADITYQHLSTVSFFRTEYSLSHNYGDNGTVINVSINDEIAELRLNTSDNFSDKHIPEAIASKLTEVNPHPYKFIINHPNFCLQHEKLVLLIAVISAVTHFDERQAVRDTWGGYARKLGTKLLFFLGDVSHNVTIYKINEESQKFQDIIQENFIDNYLNLSFKTISIMKWVSTYCPRAKWVLKIDEDNLLNVDRLMKFVRNTTSKMSMYGMLAHKWPPNRNIYSKWYVSKAQYPEEIYPDFLAGPAYLFTGDSAGELYKTSLYTPFLYLEDVYVTGIVAKKAGVKRFHLKGVTNSYQRITPCIFNRIINSHHHSARDLQRSWYITQMKFFVCLKDWFSN